MTKHEFLSTASAYIFKEVAKATNQLVGQSKTSSMIANLFLNLPLKVEARFIEDLPKPAKDMQSIENYTTAYLKHDDSSKVMIAFFYSSEKNLGKIMKRIKKHPTYFAYLYMREALKVVNLMNTKTHYSLMSTIISKANPSIPVTEHYALSLMACEYVVNSTIYKLFQASALAGEVNDIMSTQRYKTQWMNEKLSEMDVLRNLITDYYYPGFINIAMDGSFFYVDSNQPREGLTNGEISRNEEIITNLGESVSNALATMSRGTSSAPIFEEAFTAKKVKTGWFKKLTAKFAKDVHYITDTFRAEWSNLNITYRHKFKAPAHKHSEPKLSLILSIDHSGSVATEGLQKLLYLFQKHSKKITEMYILIHDEGIVKELHLNSDYDISTDPEFTKALSNRIACGGTSHFRVFNRIDELIKSKQIDPNKSIYVSFSDNYSDIPRSWDEVKSVRRMFSTVFLTPESNPMNIPGTMDIAMS